MVQVFTDLQHHTIIQHRTTATDLPRPATAHAALTLCHHVALQTELRPRSMYLFVWD